MIAFLYNVCMVVISFVAMEGIAWLTHKYIMHGWLWFLHKDHHKKDSYGFFEKNDYFFLIFAIPGILGLFIGMQKNYNFLFWMGLGITLYGFAYFFIHEIFIHQRFKWIRNIQHPYFMAIRRAHKIHHKQLQKENGECFGMLFVPLKYLKKYTHE